MADFPATVVISEEGPREGFQIEKIPVPTDRKVALIDALSATGLTQIQVGSFVSPKRVPGMADIEEVLARMQAAPGVEYTAIWFNDTGLQRALAAPHLAVAGKIRAYPSKAFLRRNLNRTPEEHLAYTHDEMRRYKHYGVKVPEGSITAAFGCNFQGDIPMSAILEEVAWIHAIAAEYDSPLEFLSLADTMAWATPQAIRRVTGAIRERWPDLPLSLHLHDTRGMGIANAYAGLQMGVAMFDSAVGGLGGCPFAAHKGAAGNVCTEDFVFLCEEMGIETGVDLEALAACGQMAEDIVGHPLPGTIMKGGSLRRLRRSLAA